jgi:hypothetical protein
LLPVEALTDARQSAQLPGMGRSVVMLGVLVAGALALGCGSDDDRGPAAGQCDDFIAAFCGRGADCIVELGCDPGHTRDQEYRACLNASPLNCDNAKAVGSTYPACMSGIANLACSAFGAQAMCTAPTLPADCSGVIFF